MSEDLWDLCCCPSRCPRASGTCAVCAVVPGACALCAVVPVDVQGLLGRVLCALLSQGHVPRVPLSQSMSDDFWDMCCFFQSGVPGSCAVCPVVVPGFLLLSQSTKHWAPQEDLLHVEVPTFHFPWRSRPGTFIPRDVHFPGRSFPRAPRLRTLISLTAMTWTLTSTVLRSPGRRRRRPPTTLLIVRDFYPHQLLERSKQLPSVRASGGMLSERRC